MLLVAGSVLPAYGQAPGQINLFPPPEPPLYTPMPPPVIPVEPVDRGFADLGRTLANGLWQQYGTDVVTELNELMPPQLVNAGNAVQNWASQNPYITGGLGVGAVAGGAFLGDQFLNEYGDNLNIHSIPLTTPAIRFENVTLPLLRFQVDITLRGRLVLRVGNNNTASLIAEIVF